MTSAIRKLRTVRDGPVNPPGLSVSAKREVCPPQRLTTDAEAIEREYDQSDAAILNVMLRAEADWLELVQLGDWRGLGQAITDELQGRLRPNARTLENPLCDAEIVRGDHRLATSIVRGLALPVYRTEVSRAFQALRRSHKDAIDFAKNKAEISRRSPITYLELPDQVECKLGWMDVDKIADLCRCTVADLLRADDNTLGARLNASEVAIVEAALQVHGWSLQTGRPCHDSRCAVKLARE